MRWCHADGHSGRPSDPSPLPADRAYHRGVETFAATAGTDGPTAPRSAALKQTLHERGLRMTPQRQLVLDAVRELGHATPEQVCTQVQRAAPAVNVTTVYRSLDLLERLGLVRHTHLGHGAPSYSADEHEHVHLVCHDCGTVTEVPREVMAELAERLDGDFGFALDVAHVALSGLCRDCRAGAPR